jgi:hypothetical protein
MVFLLAAALSGGLSGCDDGSKLEAELAEEREPRVAVSPEVKAFRQEVIGSAVFASPDYAARVRDHFDALDAGERSRAVAALGGARRVHDELRAAETYHYAHKLDACIASNFGFKEPERQAQFLRRLAGGPAGKALIAEAKRSDPDGYAFDLSGYGNDPGQVQRVAAAYDTLSLQWKSLANKGAYGDAYRVFARTFVQLAAASGGKCTPDPKLIPLLDPMPS